MSYPAEKALVLGGDERATLSVIRSLGRKGIYVQLAWHSPTSIAAKSKYVRQQLEIPSFSKLNQDWLDNLNSHVEREDYDLIIPCSDPTIIPLQQNRNKLFAVERFCLVEPSAFKICQDKIRSVALANQLDIPCPASINIQSTEELDLLSRVDGYPIIIKPQSSFDVDNYRQKAYVQPAQDSHQALSISTQLLRRGPIQIQEQVKGAGVGVEVLCKNGNVLYAFQHQRVHQPRNGGGSSYRKSMPLSPPLLDATTRLMKELDYTGVAMVEFIMDDHTNKWYFVEINARFWGSLPLAIAAKADFPFFLYEMLVHGRIDFEQKYKANIYCRNIRRDFHWFVDNVKSASDSVVEHKLPISNVLLGVKNVFLLRERFDTLAVDDMAPGINVINTLRQLIFAKRFLKALPRRRNFVHGKPTRRLKKICSKIVNHGKITFVCKGNICRSPFAELAAKRVFLDTAVESYGYFPISDRSCPKVAIESAASFRIDLANHESRYLTIESVRDAGLIFVFDAENYLHLLENYSFARNRIFLLGEFFTSCPVLINDPHGKDRSHFDSTYDEISSCIQAISNLLNDHSEHLRPSS